MNLKQTSNLASQSKLSNFLGLAGIPIFLILFMVFLLILLCTDTPNHQIERVYLAKADAAVNKDYSDQIKLMINIKHEVPDDKDCLQLRYENGILIQPCQIDEHWLIKISGRVLTIPELEQLLVIEGNMDRETKDDPKSWSNRSVMIRADGSAPCKLFRTVRAAMAKARIWKIDIAAEKPPDDY
jgi:biopolymer transport protein ExbD